jgi:UDP-N-acetylglucosamine 4,6-dehydratase/5-epimerase
LNYSSIINNKNILITGGTGSFGRQIILELMNLKPKTIKIFSRDEDKQYSMQQELSGKPILKKIEFLIGDVRDYDRLYSVMKNIDIVFHAAALKQVPTVEKQPFEAVKTNILGTYNIVKATVARDVKKVVAISTDKAVKPVNAMGMTKALQEKIILSDDLEKNNTVFSCVRYGNVLGSRGSVIPVWDRKIAEKKPLPVTHPEMTRFMLTLSEAIDLVFHSLKYSKGGEIFVKKAPSVKINDLAKAYAELKTNKKNYPIEYIGIRAGEKLHEILVSNEEMRHTIEDKNHFVIKKQKLFDTDIKKGENEFVDYGSNNVKELSNTDLKTLLKSLKWIA